MNARSLTIFAVIVAAIVGTAIWILNQNEAPHRLPPAPTVEKKPEQPVVSTPAPAPKQVESKPRDAVKPDAPKPQVAENTPPPIISEDDRKIDEVLRAMPGNSDETNTATAQNLINLLPSLSSDGQVECAQHIVNLLSDTEFSRIMPFWRNSATNADVIEVLATDLMNRDDNIKLPAMLEAAKIPNHPYHEEALTNLEIFLDGDYGNDWQKWESAMKDYLVKQAQDEAEPR